MGYNTVKIPATSYKRKTVASFIVFLLFIATCVGSWMWLKHQPDDNGTPRPLRRAMDMNELFFSRFFSNNHYSAPYKVTQAVQNPRFNGSEGMEADADTANWKLVVARAAGDTLRLSLAQIEALPKTDIVFDFKCIEGWDQVTHWGGVRFSDFMKAYGLDSLSGMRYTSLVTPDKQYYVGIDMASMLHPQTLLCYEMNGKPLPLKNGYPLRLIIPVKYGIKHLKRIGSISFSNERPPDYWYERGYDYYSGL
jgi:DMSO/TMAO reductase YedYZ molybdopterin-dependent catalytic subunit